MSRDWRTIFRFAILGLAIAAVFFMFLETNLLVDIPMLGWAFGAALLFCPGIIPYAWWMAAGELPVQNVKLMWLVIGLINFVFYAALGAAYVRVRTWRAGIARNYDTTLQ